ncbi:hypothetical protein EH233_29310 [Anabaena sp. YBS01]|nr:hypothetical protein EH233_29310 [Anabaena sp. YBS01]
MGKQSKSWRTTVDSHDNPVVKIQFDKSDCSLCSSRSKCTRSKKLPRLGKFWFIFLILHLYCPLCQYSVT